MDIKELNLPSSWATVKLGHFVENEKGKKPKNESKVKTTTHTLPYIDIQAFEDNVVRTWADGVGCRLCYDTDFLMVWDGSRSGLVGKGMNGALGSTLVRIYFPSMVNDYAFYFLQSKYQQINTRAKGVGIPHVDPDLLWNYDFPIAPLNEQQRIVAKIDELFSELDKGIENLETAQAQLKVYRQALLKHAFEGKLTAEWRAQNADKLESASALQQRIQQAREQRYEQQLAEWQANGKQGSKPKAPKPITPLTTEELAELPELPEGWGWEKNENYLSEIKDGTHDTPKYVQEGIPFVTQKNIRDGKLDMANVSFISIDDHKKFYKRSNVQKGDLIISMIGHGRGECCLVNVDTIFSIKNVGLFKFFNGLQSSEFLKFFYQSTGGLNMALSKSKGGAQPFIGLTELRDWPVPVCSHGEQKVIVELLDTRLSEADQLDQTITTSLQQAEALRQSILKKAFSGELVPQDPNDEPASALLERIKAEKNVKLSK